MKRMHDIEITSEGVFINGTALPGGSKLYKHACRGDFAFANKTFIFISTSGESYVGSYSDSKLRSDLAEGKIVSATMLNDSGTPVASSVVLVDTGTAVAGLLAPASLNPTGTALASQNIITPTPGITADVVTEL